ncbi:MAG: prepilin peptidase [Bacteroidota bacterium]
MLAQGSLLLCLLIMLWQDWKYRRIHVLLPMLVFAIGMFMVNGFVIYKSILVNIVFFIIVFASLVLYMSLKAKAFLNPLEHYFGLGDVMFYIAITPFFNVKQYAVFFIASMIFALVMQLLVKKHSNHITVPLAGFSSLLLFIVMLVDAVSISTYKFTIL